MADIDINESPFPKSPVMPELFEGDKKITFQCRKGIACWNACCSNIDIALTPNDIIGLKNRLGMTSWDFLREYTVPYEMEKNGIAGVKFKPVDGGTACRFMTEEGCSVYEDRPTACRYYPVALVALRKQDEYVDRNQYALVEEKHCLGHAEPRQITIADYRKEQGIEARDEIDRGWRQLILKKRSSGPSIGTPSLRSRQLFFMASYDVDRLREFIKSEGFQAGFEVDAQTLERLYADDVELLQFGYRLLKQVLFGENSIPIRAGAREEWEARRRAELAARNEPQVAEYDPAAEPVELV